MHSFLVYITHSNMYSRCIYIYHLELFVLLSIIAVIKKFFRKKAQKRVLLNKYHLGGWLTSSRGSWYLWALEMNWVRSLFCHTICPTNMSEKWLKQDISFFCYLTTVVQQLTSQIFYMPDHISMLSLFCNSIKLNVYLIDNCN